MPVKTPAHLLPQLEPLEKKYDADVFMHSGYILDEGPETIKSEISKTKLLTSSRKNALLILTTLGGYAEPAYQIANIFQRKYDKFYVYNPYYCKSAGTLLCLGANKLIMDEFAEIGPLDVQLPSRKYVNSFRSGAQFISTLESLSIEVCKQYTKILEKITEIGKGEIDVESAQDIAKDLTIGIMHPIFSQIDPHELGSDYRNLDIAVQYGRRLAAKSKNPREETITQLVAGYPSHNFVINFNETCSLFKNVEMGSDDFRVLIQNVSKYFHIDKNSEEDRTSDTNYFGQTFSLTFGLRNIMYPKEVKQQ